MKIFPKRRCYDSHSYYFMIPCEERLLGSNPEGKKTTNQPTKQKRSINIKYEITKATQNQSRQKSSGFPWKVRRDHPSVA